MKFDKYQILMCKLFYLGGICTIEPDPSFIFSEPIDNLLLMSFICFPQPQSICTEAHIHSAFQYCEVRKASISALLLRFQVGILEFPTTNAHSTNLTQDHLLSVPIRLPIQSNNQCLLAFHMWPLNVILSSLQCQIC